MVELKSEKSLHKISIGDKDDAQIAANDHSQVMTVLTNDRVSRNFD